MSDIMIKNMMKMVNQILPPKEEPTNAISEFVTEKISEMITEPEIADVFTTVFVSYCNKDPQTAYKTLIGLANDIAQMNRDIIAIVDAEDVEVMEGE